MLPPCSPQGEAQPRIRSWPAETRDPRAQSPACRLGQPTSPEAGWSLTASADKEAVGLAEAPGLVRRLPLGHWDPLPRGPTQAHRVGGAFPGGAGEKRACFSAVSCRWAGGEDRPAKQGGPGPGPAPHPQCPSTSCPLPWRPEGSSLSGSQCRPPPCGTRTRGCRGSCCCCRCPSGNRSRQASAGREAVRPRAAPPGPQGPTQGSITRREPHRDWPTPKGDPQPLWGCRCPGLQSREDRDGDLASGTAQAQMCCPHVHCLPQACLVWAAGRAWRRWHQEEQGRGGGGSVRVPQRGGSLQGLTASRLPSCPTRGHRQRP